MGCGRCHTCGSELRRVLDGEEWGAAGEDSPCQVAEAKDEIEPLGGTINVSELNGTWTAPIWCPNAAEEDLIITGLASRESALKRAKAEIKESVIGSIL